MAVDDTHVYWNNAALDSDGGGAGTAIGRANLDGTGVDQRLITGGMEPCGFTFDH